MDDAKFMRRALELAVLADGSVSPRPPVGAVVVVGGDIVGEGWTRSKPGPHAEGAALEQAAARGGARGATVFVTLEPCNTKTSKPASCAELLISAGVSRVVAAVTDPCPDVNGRGFAMLRDAGIAVEIGQGEVEARALIEPFAKWTTTGRPFVTLKLATTLDGKVAAPDGTSRWITGQQARAESHELRRRVDAVVVGSGTVEADDPSLTFRDVEAGGSQPLRVLLDSSGRTDPSAKVFDHAAPALVVTTSEVPIARREDWQRAGADVAVVASGEGGVDLAATLTELGRRGMCHVLCEAGPKVAGSFVASGLVDRFVLYVAPKLIGGDAPSALGVGVKTVADAWELEIEDVRTVGDDVRIDARPKTRKAS